MLGLGSRRDSRDRVRLLGSVWLAYVAGGVGGSALDERIALWALALPLAVLLAVIAVDLLRPLEL